MIAVQFFVLLLQNYLFLILFGGGGGGPLWYCLGFEQRPEVSSVP